MKWSTYFFSSFWNIKIVGACFAFLLSFDDLLGTVLHKGLSILLGLQEKEAYRWAIKETIKGMLAFGWSIERTKEGDAFDMHSCTCRVSQSGQVYVLSHSFSHWALNVSDLVKGISFIAKLLSYCIRLLAVPAVFWRNFNLQPQTCGHEQHHLIMGAVCKCLDFFLLYARWK